MPSIYYILVPLIVTFVNLNLAIAIHRELTGNQMTLHYLNATKTMGNVLANQMLSEFIAINAK